MGRHSEAFDTQHPNYCYIVVTVPGLVRVRNKQKPSPSLSLSPPPPSPNKKQVFKFYLYPQVFVLSSLFLTSHV